MAGRIDQLLLLREALHMSMLFHLYDNNEFLASLSSNCHSQNTHLSRNCRNVHPVKPTGETQMKIARRMALAGLALSGFVIASPQAFTQSMDELEANARKEGTVVSLGMPNDWANWGAQWKAITERYGVTHTDTDMSSAEELAKFEAEKSNPSADIGEVGLEFGPIAVKRGLSQPYKPTNWDKIPAWAKDEEGHWMLGYTGTIAFVISKSVKNPPKSWADLASGEYKVAVGDVGKAAQSNALVLAAAIATGGGEENLQPAIDLFAKLAEQKRLLTIGANPGNMEKGEIEVGIVWDFNALNYRNIVGKEKFDVVIPADGSVTSGYTTTINAYSKRPNIAKLVREYMFTEEGQINFARGYARPILIDSITLPPDVVENVLPKEQYAKARPVNAAVWMDAAKQLGKMWQEQVLSKM
jgi:putative spermidine/putrescine transport system substrate-binding protein